MLKYIIILLIVRTCGAVLPKKTNYKYINYPMNSRNWCKDRCFCMRNNKTLTNFRCVTEECHLNNTCGRVAKRMRFSYLSKLNMARLLNDFRQRWALGIEGSTSGSQVPHPYASTIMNVLSWHEDLAALSQCITNMCYIHYDNVRSRKYPNMTCNSQLTGVINNFTLNYKAQLSYDTMKHIVRPWFDAGIIFRDYFQIYGQAVFESNLHDIITVLYPHSKYFGCGATTYRQTILYVVCLMDQAPKPNDMIIKQGYSATQCPMEMPPNKSYVGMCGIVKHVFKSTATKRNPIDLVLGMLQFVLIQFLVYYC